MLKHYLVISIRNLWKQKLFSIISVFGLAAGMAVSVLALINLKSAYEYDLFHPFPERTYRILTRNTFQDGGKQLSGFAPYGLASELNDYSFIEQTAVASTRFSDFETDGALLTMRYCFVNPAFFKVFGFSMLAGTLDPAPYSMVITPDAATKFFGKNDPVGQYITGVDSVSYKITGIISQEKKSHLKFDGLMSLATLPLLKQEVNIPTAARGVEQSSLYVLLKPGTNQAVLRNALYKIARQKAMPFIKDPVVRSVDFDIQPLGEITPASNKIAGYSGALPVINLLGQLCVGLVAMFLAGFNYVNLTLARAISRAKEIGVRKVAGASKAQLFGQFVIESVILSILAVFGCLLLLRVIRPIKQINDILLRTEWDFKTLSLLTLFTLITGLLSGIVPAKVLSSFSAVTAMKGRGEIKVLHGLTLQKILTAAQLTVSLVGIVFMIVMLRQQRYDTSGDFGFNYKNVLNIHLGKVKSQLAAVEMARQPGVERVAQVSHFLGARRGGYDSVSTIGPKPARVAAELLSADTELVHLAGLELLAGRNIRTSASSEVETVINERAATGLKFNTPAQAFGQQILFQDSGVARIVGVVKDFRNERMTHDIQPLLIYYHPPSFAKLQVKIEAGADPKAISQALAARWKTLDPATPLEASWYVDQLYKINSHEDDISFVSSIILLVLSIACLGMLGMVTYTTEMRTKEIGIRKIMGANVSRLIRLLSRDFTMLLGIATAIAFPVGYLVSRLFLNTLVYRITLGPGIFLTGLVAVAAIGGLTIGIQTFRAAIKNPVTNLRVD